MQPIYRVEVRVHQRVLSAATRWCEYGGRVDDLAMSPCRWWCRGVPAQPDLPSAPQRVPQSECEVQCIISAALILVTLMPMFPVALIDFIQDLFQVLR